MKKIYFPFKKFNFHEKKSIFHEEDFFANPGKHKMLKNSMLSKEEIRKWYPTMELSTVDILLGNLFSTTKFKSGDET